MSKGLYVETTGRGPPIVLWHGWGMNLRCFDALRDALADEHEVIAVDLPGHGRSPWREEWRHGGWLDALLQTLPAPKPTAPPAPTPTAPPAPTPTAQPTPRPTALLGWSLGGQLALQAAAEENTRVQRLVLFGTTPRFTRAPDWPHGVAPELVRDFHTRLSRDAAQVVADFLELELRGDAEAAAHRNSLRAALAAHGQAHPEALDAGLALLERNDLRPLAPRVRQPTLVFSGQHDRVTLAAAGAALAAALPRARHLLLPRAGHAPMLSADGRWLAPLREFLRGET